MAVQFLHRHAEFERLIAIVADKEEMLPGLIEKDYWIMHVFYGLQSIFTRLHQWA